MTKSARAKPAETKLPQTLRVTKIVTVGKCIFRPGHVYHEVKPEIAAELKAMGAIADA